MTASGRRRIVVINRNGAPRYAISFFLGPNHDWIVGCVPTCIGPANPPRYEPTTSGGFTQRLLTLISHTAALRAIRCKRGLLLMEITWAFCLLESR
jgi:isopenicillin N synthase-like dioxygenase